MRAEEEAELVAKTGKGDAGSGRMLGCPPAESETSMASQAGLGVLRSRWRSSIVKRMWMVTARWRSD